MATVVPRLEDKEYLNWLSDCIALLHLKEGLEAFIDVRVKRFHDELHTRVPQSCSRPSQTQKCTLCTKEEVKRNKDVWTVKCDSNICKKWLENILNYHVEGKGPYMVLKNLNPPSWPFDEWEAAKVFLPLGCEKVTQAKHADVAAILKLMKNCSFMHSFYNKTDVVDELLEIRNKLMHSIDLKVSDVQLKNDTERVLELLNSLVGTSPTEAQDVQKAVDDITKLKTMGITFNREVVVLHSRMQAVETDLASLKDEYEQARREQNRSTEQLKSLEVDYGNTKKELQIVKKKFESFLRENKLENDVAGLSKIVDQHDYKLELHRKKLDQLERKVDKLETGGLSANVKPPETKDVQSHLVACYEERLGWVNPVMSETEDVQIYVKPEIKFVFEKTKGTLRPIDPGCPPAVPRSFGERDIASHMETAARKTLTAFSKILSLSEKEYKNIYLTGDAGSGKSALCHQVVRTWCNAVKNSQEKCQSKDDIAFMAGFKYVFYIELRGTNKYDVKDMIYDQLLCQGPKSVPSFDIEIALREQKCLVILDGLDEWTVPDGAKTFYGINKNIPGRNTMQTKSVFLTTLRSWKFHSISLDGKEVDKHVELYGIGEDSSRKLAKSVAEHLDNKTGKQSNVEQFYDKIKEKKLSELSSVPILLIQMVTLWHFGKDIGKSQVHLFCGMVNLFFEIAKKHFSSRSEGMDQNVQEPTKLPICFNQYKYCKTHESLLLCLAKIAYVALFSKQKEESLIISSSTIEECGTRQSDIEYCLKCGILSQNKDYEKYIRKDCTYSFLHKKVQEFFAALYIVTGDDAEEIVNRLKKECNSLDTTQEMYQVWLFLSGMDGNLAKQMIAHLAYLMNIDQKVQEYRRKGDLYDSPNKDTITEIQSFIANCVTESAESGQTLDNVMLADLFVDDYKLTNAKHVVPQTDSTALKSAYLCSINLAPDSVTAITNQLGNCSSLKKLVLFDSYPQVQISDVAIAKIAKTSYKTLTWLRLSFVELTENTIPAMFTCKVIRLLYCKAAHGVYEKTLATLSKMSGVTQLVVDIECIEDDRQCRPVLNISQCSQLKKLELHCMTVEGLASVADRLEEITLNDVTIATDLSDFVNKLSQTKIPVTVKLVQVTVTPATFSCEDLKGFFNRHPFTETDCRYDNIYETWDISFNINRASRREQSDTSDREEA